MPRKVFFSFHYERDVRRIQQVRQSWVVRERGAAPPFYDKAEFEDAKRRVGGIENWIEEQLSGCSVTAVLFGRETYDRPWVKHEIQRSYQRNMGILAIDIHNIRDPLTGTDQQGRNPLELWSAGGKSFTSMYRTYDWVRDDGYNNIGAWIERAARDAGR
ncbi:TIR-like domain-containing protein [Rhizobium leguminosarum bv. trifolii]|uniref:TIR-like domain-containing protein n=1 Tax=Rhizobium leguminosarum bv. trifolii TaxID=386 RepID=A0A3E1BH19_RHILT|nr:TIR domain-containing protein [Rhizobium leguminosarum]RFB91800.1 TIR-like domain-containing protein [Rhizobium leguminosarum bv. trifolii]RFB92317.1 TIR-like domain-containing protein [Rhizobium leguminosarum bv. trifolii]